MSSTRRELARLDDEGDALVAVEPGQRGQRAAFDLDDRDAQAGRVQDQLLERLATLRDDEQPDRRAAGREGLLDRATAGDELLVGTKQVRGRQRRSRPVPWLRSRRRPGAIAGRATAHRWPPRSCRRPAGIGALESSVHGLLAEAPGCGRTVGEARRTWTRTGSARRPATPLE